MDTVTTSSEKELSQRSQTSSQGSTQKIDASKHCAPPVTDFTDLDVDQLINNGFMTDTLNNDAYRSVTQIKLPAQAIEQAPDDWLLELMELLQSKNINVIIYIQQRLKHHSEIQQHLINALLKSVLQPFGHKIQFSVYGPTQRKNYSWSHFYTLCQRDNRLTLLNLLWGVLSVIVIAVAFFGPVSLMHTLSSVMIDNLVSAVLAMMVEELVVLLSPLILFTWAELSARMPQQLCYGGALLLLALFLFVSMHLVSLGAACVVLPTLFIPGVLLHIKAWKELFFPKHDFGYHISPNLMRCCTALSVVYLILGIVLFEMMHSSHFLAQLSVLALPGSATLWSMVFACALTACAVWLLSCVLVYRYRSRDQKTSLEASYSYSYSYEESLSLNPPPNQSDYNISLEDSYESGEEGQMTRKNSTPSPVPVIG